MNKTYEPDREFVDRLEWQLSSEYRRRARLKSSGRIAVSRRVIVLSVVAGVLLAGVAATKAADLIHDSWRKKLEVAKAETDLKLATAHWQFKREQAAKAEVKASMGLIPQEDFQVMKLAVDKSALDLRKSESNLEEVRTSGEAPRNELYAPVVGGRDFVGERLQIELEILAQNLELRRVRMEQLRQRVETGLVPQDRLGESRAASAAQEAEIASAQERLDLRRQFIAGNLTAQEVEIRDRMAVAERDLAQARLRVDSFKKELERAQNLEAMGLAADPSVRGLKFALNSAQEELTLAAQEIEILKKVK